MCLFHDCVCAFMCVWGFTDLYLIHFIDAATSHVSLPAQTVNNHVAHNWLVNREPVWVWSSGSIMWSNTVTPLIRTVSGGLNSLPSLSFLKIIFIICLLALFFLVKMFHCFFILRIFHIYILPGVSAWKWQEFSCFPFPVSVMSVL